MQATGTRQQNGMQQTQTKVGGVSRPRSSREQGVQYPEPRQNTGAPRSKSGFPKIRDANGEVYLFIRFRSEYIHTIKSACVMQKRVVQNFGGEFVGIAERITLIEGDQYRGLPDTGILLLKFRSFDDCKRWTSSDTKFKQKDFLSPEEVEMFIIPLHYVMEEEFKNKSFLLTEMWTMRVDRKAFEEHYVEPVAKQLNTSEIYHGVVASMDVERIRNCMIRPRTFVLLHASDSAEKLRDFFDSGDYTQYRNTRQSTFFTESDSCLFTLKPVM